MPMHAHPNSHRNNADNRRHGACITISTEFQGSMLSQQKARSQSLPSLLRGRDVMHWIDNTSAASVLLHGYSGKPDSARLANIFHMFNAGLRARIYFEYVESKANVADLPSRGDFDYLRSLRALRVPMRFPLSSEWHAPLRHWISLAAPSAGRKRGRSRVPGRRRKHRRLGVASDT